LFFKVICNTKKAPLMALEKDLQDSITTPDLSDVEQTLAQPLYGWQRFIAPFQDPSFTMGIICIAFSTLVFLFNSLSDIGVGGDLGFFEC
jgi:hypothetical protein